MLPVFLAGIAVGVGATIGIFWITHRNPLPSGTPTGQLKQHLSSEEKLNLYKSMKQSAVVIHAHFNRSIVRGSGVVVLKEQKRALVVTNAHVIQQKGTISRRVEIKTYGSQSFVPAQVVKWFHSERDQLDVAYLIFPDPKDLAKPADLVPLNTNLAAGMPVYAVGNPQDEEFFIDDGTLSDVRIKGDLKLLIHDAITEHGSSGGGIFDGQGHLIGINTWLVNDTLGMAAEINSLIQAHDMRKEAGRRSD